MKKKFICTVCGYVYEGDAAPEQCPVCKAPASKFKELVEGEEDTFATVHELRAAPSSCTVAKASSSSSFSSLNFDAGALHTGHCSGAASPS